MNALKISTLTRGELVDSSRLSSKLLNRISVSVLIVKSTTPGSFCAGADLTERRTMNKLQVAKFLSDLRAVLGKLENLPMPTLAAIDGPALGGGLELSLACDLRVAGIYSIFSYNFVSKSNVFVGATVTKIGLPETRLGIIPGAGGTQRATRLIGLSKTKDLIYTARTLTAPEALEIGDVEFWFWPWLQSNTWVLKQVSLTMYL